MIASRRFPLLAGAVLFLSSTARALTPPPQTFVLENPSYPVQFPASPLLNLTPQYTIEFWVMPENNQAHAFLGKPLPNGNGAWAYQFGFDENGGINYGQSTGVASTYVQRTSASAVLTHTWTHVAATSDGETIRLYLNGIQSIEFASPGAPGDTTSIPLELGDGGGGCIFAIRQLRFWSSALTPGQLAASATSRLSGSEPGLVSDWPFDDAAIGVGHDIGPNHLDLPLPGVGDYSPPYPPIRWIHTAVLDAGPFFSFEGPFPMTSVITSQGGITSAALIHLGSSGVPDVVVREASTDNNVPGTLVVLRNDGAGHFTDQSTATFGGPAPAIFSGPSLLVADFDGDGRDDLFVNGGGEGRTPYWGAQSHLLLQTSLGQLTDVTSTNLPTIDTYAAIACAADIDGSGHNHIYVNLTHFVQVQAPLGPLFYDNDSSGHFTMNQSRLPADFLEPTADGTLWAAGTFIDARHNSLPDLVVCCSNSNVDPGTADTLLLNDGHGHFTEAPPGTMPVSSSPFSTVTMATGDFDGDGWDDIVEDGISSPVSGTSRGSMRVLLNNHDGTFREAPGAIRGTDNYLIQYFLLGDIRVADLNGDGPPDVFIETAATPLAFLNTGDGHFIDATEILPIDFAALGGVKFFATDIDGNGSVDLIGIGANGQYFTIARQLRPATLDLFNPLKIVTPVEPPPVTLVQRRRP